MKKITPKFLGKVSSTGELQLNNIVLYKQYLLNLKECEVEIVVKKHYSKSRSLNQNSYYHGVILLLLSNHLGYTTEEMHEALKIKFLSSKNDHNLTFYQSTTNLTTVEFEEYLNKIREWASIFLNIYIPTPHEVDYEKR